MNLSAISAAIQPLQLRSCLINREGQLVLEHYRNTQVADQIAKTNSCTKSFLSALLCIAFDRGLLPPPDTQIRTFFPSLNADSDERKREITLRHLLTMSGGWNWTEFGEHNSFPRMTRSAIGSGSPWINRWPIAPATGWNTTRAAPSSYRQSWSKQPACRQPVLPKRTCSARSASKPTAGSKTRREFIPADSDCGYGQRI